MDERASSMLALGNSELANQVARAATVRDNIGALRDTATNLNNQAKADLVTKKEENYGIDTKDLFASYGDLQRLKGSLGRASQAYQAGPVIAERARLMAEGRSASIVDKASLLANPESKIGTVGKFIDPRFQYSEATKAVASLGERAADIGEEGDAVKQAALGLPRLFQKTAEFVGEAPKSAAAIGDVVGHGVGLATAGYGIVKDISGGWSTMDKNQKEGNVLGIAGGIADAASAAVPILIPFALGLNALSAFKDWEGDEDASKIAKAANDATRDQGIAQQQAQLKAAAPVAVQTTGNVATGTQALQSKASMGGGSGAF